MSANATIDEPNIRSYSKTVNTVDEDEIEKFKKFSQWWDTSGPWKALHAMNPQRINLIREGLAKTGILNGDALNDPLPFKGITFLDIGCGPGILSEPLTRLGGTVTGVDANPDVIQIAKDHAKQGHLDITYEMASIEAHAEENPEKYDVIVASEIVEHVEQKDDFIAACMACLKPTGSIFLTTFSKTKWAKFVGIQLGENLTGLVPKGTHQLDKFIKPKDLKKLVENHGGNIVLVKGWFYNPFTNNWPWWSITSVNYVLHAVKISK